MARKQDRKFKPYKIIGAYDSETCNVVEKGLHRAFPMLHQLGIIGEGYELTDITNDNVTELVGISVYRHAVDLFAALDAIVESECEYVPVICCHNLAFDMYGLSPWLDSKDVRVLAKSRRKPITFAIMDEHGHKRLVLWDTLVFSGQPLSRMGFDCGFEKAVGEWDYLLTRTPETPLTALELDYAQKDVYTLLTWLSWWLRLNPDIEPEKLALNVVTKTGVVRERRKVCFDQLKGVGAKQNVGRYWMYRNRLQLPKTDDELFYMNACTRGGFTFCASACAGIPYDLTGSDMLVYGYDATSQHPSMMVSHKYPIDFHETSVQALEKAFSVIRRYSFSAMLENWEKPFTMAFNACFEFTNIRPKANSVFERFGILPLASARFTGEQMAITDDNEQNRLYAEYTREAGYSDSCINGDFAFGKLISADVARVYITELTAWEICQCYDFDSVKAVGGYLSTRYARPTDMSLISVMQFYKAKNVFKEAREQYYRNGRISNGEALRRSRIAEPMIIAMENGTAIESDIESTYLSLKADLNALFGIEACNEFRRETVMTSSGIDYEGSFGICNAPKNPKAWYQFGQRTVGWSRIAQIAVMILAEPYVKAIINGDTDSIKFLAKREEKENIDAALKTLDNVIDKAKEDICSRIEAAYPTYYDDLAGIGHYICEFEADRFCASWNKAYCIQELGRNGQRHFKFTLAGIPTRLGVNIMADQLYAKGWSFAKICNLLLGFNVMYAPSVTYLNGRSFPEWASGYFGSVTDYQGNTSKVAEPAALSLYPMTKTINDLASDENKANYRYVKRNNPDISAKRIICTSTMNDQMEQVQLLYRIIETGLDNG